MKVKLLQMTQNPIDIMWTAARTCYSAKSPIEMWEDVEEFYVNPDNVSVDNYKQLEDKHWNLVKKVLSSGHASIAEHINFTFAIEGVSRALLAQLTRHRAGVVFSVASQRYIEIKEDISLLEGKNFGSATYLQETEVIKMLDKYFIWNHQSYTQFHALTQALYCYLFQVREGIKPEDARMVLPNATKTNITMTINLRELMHISNLRLCTKAQLEIRQLFQEIKKEVEKAEPRLAEFLVPKCINDGYCREAKPCYYYKKVLNNEE